MTSDQYEEAVLLLAKETAYRLKRYGRVLVKNGERTVLHLVRSPQGNVVDVKAAERALRQSGAAASSSS